MYASKNQGVEIGVAPFSLVPSGLLREFILLVHETLDTVDLEVDNFHHDTQKEIH